MNPIPAIVAHVFQTDAPNPVARLVHVALAALADEHGRADTTVHTLEHLTGLLPEAIELVLGANHLNEPMFPGRVDLIDGVVHADLLPAGVSALMVRA